MFATKSKLCSLVMLAALASITASPAFSQQTTKPITISRPAVLAGRQIQKGSYSIKFDDDKDGDLVFMKGSGEVARAPYKLVKLNKAAAETIVAYMIADDGSYRIHRIEFKGMAVALTV